MSNVCPHCQAVCAPGATFCMSCGKAVSTGSAGGPRVITAADYASTGSGRTLQAEELLKQTKKACGALTTVAVLQTIFGALIVFTASQGQSLGPIKTEGVDIKILSLFVFGLAAVFFGLAFWARKSPFPAAITGLVVFVTVHLLDAIADPTAIIRGILIKIVIVVILSRAISAGVKYKAMLKTQGVGA